MIGVTLAISATRTVTQPNGEDMTWIWRLDTVHERPTDRLLVTPDHIVAHGGIELHTYQPGTTSGGQEHENVDEVQSEFDILKQKSSAVEESRVEGDSVDRPGDDETAANESGDESTDEPGDENYPEKRFFSGLEGDERAQYYTVATSDPNPTKQDAPTFVLIGKA